MSVSCKECRYFEPNKDKRNGICCRYPAVPVAVDVYPGGMKTVEGLHGHGAKRGWNGTSRQRIRSLGVASSP